MAEPRDPVKNRGGPTEGRRRADETGTISSGFQEAGVGVFEGGSSDGNTATDDTDHVRRKCSQGRCWRMV